MEADNMMRDTASPRFRWTRFTTHVELHEVGHSMAFAAIYKTPQALQTADQRRSVFVWRVSVLTADGLIRVAHSRDEKTAKKLARELAAEAMETKHHRAETAAWSRRVADEERTERAAREEHRRSAPQRLAQEVRDAIARAMRDGVDARVAAQIAVDAAEEVKLSNEIIVEVITEERVAVGSECSRSQNGYHVRDNQDCCHYCGVPVDEMGSEVRR